MNINTNTNIHHNISINTNTNTKINTISNTKKNADAAGPLGDLEHAATARTPQYFLL